AGSDGQGSSGFNPFEEHTDTTSPRREVITNPTVAQVMQTGPLPEMSWGSDAAPVTVIKYASLTCPICRKFQREVFPKFKKAYIDTGKVRYIIREFPIGRSSGNATIALRCAKPSKYLPLYKAFLSQQSRWVSQDVRLDAIHAVAKPFGLSRTQFDACLENQEMIAGLKWIKDRGRTLGIIGTPNFFIQGKLYKKALGYEDLKREVDAALTPSLASAG
ncbi:MAG: DsbA family protein, partial [Pseudomonadota bacterium]